MSDEENEILEENDDFVPEPEPSKLGNSNPNPNPEPKKGPKGKRVSVPPTPERLEILARAREKALAVRRANAEARGKGKQREEAKQKADNNRKEADEKFNKLLNVRVEEELAKRMNQINLDKMNELLEEKLKDIKTPRKPRKKIVYEDTETESKPETIIVKKKRQPKKVEVKEPEPELVTPAINVDNVDTPQKPPPLPGRVPMTTFNPMAFNNMLRSVPNTRRNPYN
jgi:hypothetical protein